LRCPPRPSPRGRGFCAVVFICSSFLASAAFAVSPNEIKPQAPKEPIIVNGDNVEYFNEKKMVTGTGSISIKYKDIELTCDKITVYLDTREAIAEGNVRVTQQGTTFTGERMNYNFETKKGTVLGGELASRPFYGKAQQADKVANKDEYRLERGYATTCDLDEPHYRVQARHVEVYLGDKIVAKHIVLFIKNVPVLYFPYYVQSLKQRKSQVTVMAGKKSDWGYYALTSYRYHVSDKLMGDLLLDYRSKKGMGLAAGANTYYDFGELGKGAFKFYVTKEDGDNETHLSEIYKRYRYQARHFWDIGSGSDTQMLLELNKLSDVNVIRDYFYNEYDEMGPNPDNYLTFITKKPDYTAEFLMRTRLNKFQDVVERLPQYTINIYNMNIIKNAPFYYTGSAAAAYLTHQLPANGTVQKAPEVVRFDANNQLSYMIQLFRTLNMTPYVGTEDTYYSRTLGGETNRIRTVFNAGINNSVKFYRIFDVTTNFLGLDINKLRHVITPTANYIYTHQPAIGPQKLVQMDEIDAVDKQNHITLGLENRLQTKRHGKSVDLATLYINSDYAFRLKKDQVTIYKEKFTNLNFRLELIPYEWFYSVCELAYNTKNSAVSTASIDVAGSGGRDWYLAARYEYQKELEGIQNFVTADIGYRFNDKWWMRAYERFSVLKGSFPEQEYTLYRDLHCVVAELTLNIQPHENVANIWFVLRLKAFPETPIGLKRAYSRPRFGEAPATRYGFVS